MKKLRKPNQKMAPSTGIFRLDNLKRIQFKKMYWVERLDFEFPRKNICRIKIFFKIQRRDNGKRGRICATCDLNMCYFSRTREIISWVRKTAKEGVGHEVDECLYIDNKRIYDPHK